MDIGDISVAFDKSNYMAYLKIGKDIYGFSIFFVCKFIHSIIEHLSDYSMNIMSFSNRISKLDWMPIEVAITLGIINDN